MARVKLPMWIDLVSEQENSVARMRERLGGRVGPERFRGCGERVLAQTEEGARWGVVLTRDDTGAFVWTGPREVRRLPGARLVEPPARAVADPEASAQRAAHDDERADAVSAQAQALHEMASVARTFGALQEGDAVAFLDVGGVWAHGVLIEKCRFGGLVRREPNVVVAVGFQSLRPAAAALH